MVPDQSKTQAALGRALRRMLTESGGGSMQPDFGAAVIAAARDVLDGEPRIVVIDDICEYFGVSLYADDVDDDLQIPLGDREAGATAIARFLVDDWVLTEVLEVVAKRCHVAGSEDDEQDEDETVTTYEFTVDDRAYSFVHNENLKVGRSMWRFERTVDGVVAAGDAADSSTADDPVDGPRVLARRLREMLREAESGSLPHDLARVLVDAANEVLDHTVPDREISLVELNEMFLLDLGDHFTDAQKRSYTIRIDDREDGAWDVGHLLVNDEHFEDVLGIAAGPCSLIDSSPEGSVGVYEFTVDDGVYYFACGDMEAQTPEWWFGHSVNDREAREQARGVGPRELWDMDLWEQEQAGG